MFFLPKKTIIAADAVVYIAYKQSDKPVSSKEICKFMNLSLRNLEQVLQCLVKVGILKSIRGTTGGYFLGKEKRKITILDIYSAVRKLEKRKFPKTNEILETILTPVDDKVFEVAKTAMQNINIQDLHNTAQQIGLKSIKKTNSDFTI